MSSIAHRGFVHLGPDVSKNSIAVAVLPPDRDVAEVDKIFHDSDSFAAWSSGSVARKGSWACYEAGPTGYDLQRLLSSMGCAAMWCRRVKLVDETIRRHSHRPPYPTDEGSPEGAGGGIDPSGAASTVRSNGLGLATRRSRIIQ